MKQRVLHSRACIFLFIVMFISPILIRIMPANTACGTHPIHNGWGTPPFIFLRVPSAYSPFLLVLPMLWALQAEREEFFHLSMLWEQTALEKDKTNMEELLKNVKQ